MRRLRSIGTALLVVATFGSYLTSVHAAEPTSVTLPLPYPEIWGARLPGDLTRRHYTDGIYVAPQGDLVFSYIEFDNVEMGEGFPQTIFYYSFFDSKMLHSVRIPALDSQEFRSLKELRTRNFQPHDSNHPYQHLFLRRYLFKEGPRVLYSLAGSRVGTIEEKELFRAHETSLFPHVYIRKDKEDRTLGDKVFVEVFQPPAEIIYRRPSRYIATGDDYYKRTLAAASPAFPYFKFLPDETLVTYDDNRLFALRLTRELDSPFFKQDGRLMAIDGALFRRWIAAARNRLPKRYNQSSITDAQEYMPLIDAELTENILREWRRGK